MYMLISTDGYSIQTEKFKTKEEAKDALSIEYNDYKPEDWDEEMWGDQSYIGNIGAKLFTGEDVFVWSIVEI